jgi:hypothetical protein
VAGYVRQSAASIVPSAIVRAAPINNEYNALRDAFVQATGHKHDGTAAEGAYVPLISDSNAYNKIVVDSVNNRIGIFNNVSSAAVEQLRFQNGIFSPVTNNAVDIGTSSFKFKDLYLAGLATLASVAIAGGTINGTTIGATTASTGAFTSLTANTAAINGGSINGTTIGATTPSTGVFTNLTVNTAATIASAAISAGTINGTVIGGTTAAAITGTTITANTGFVGGLTGAVTGNVTGNLTGNVTGNVTGDLAGNVTTSSGTSTFNNVTINGVLDMNSATTGSNTITGLTTPSNASDAATKSYVDTSISNLVNSAPGALDTLAELATALGNDASFSTTITNSLATKLALAGGTMSGAIAMGTNKITGLGTPTATTDATTKTYVDTADALKLSLTGGTMSGAIAMGTNKITGLGDPTLAQDAATKTYVDGILGSATSAAASAAAAATSASNAATSASNASTSASGASASAASAAASYDSFDDRYLGPKASDPTLDNDGNALLTGALYFNTTSNEMRVYTGSAWVAAYISAGVYVPLSGGTMTGDLVLGTQKSVRFADLDSSNYVAFKAASVITNNVVWTLPATDGTTGQTIITDGSGTLSWGAGGGGGSTNLDGGTPTSSYAATTSISGGTP